MGARTKTDPLIYWLNVNILRKSLSFFLHLWNTKLYWMLGFPPQSSNLNVMASFILACSSSNFDGLREKFPLACLCLNSQPVSQLWRGSRKKCCWLQLSECVSLDLSIEVHGHKNNRRSKKALVWGYTETAWELQVCSGVYTHINYPTQCKKYIYHLQLVEFQVMSLYV